jgi:4-amino-4-deoxy-L-arabinose transferase-like glycosyltransferase
MADHADEGHQQAVSIASVGSQRHAAGRALRWLRAKAILIGLFLLLTVLALRVLPSIVIYAHPDRALGGDSPAYLGLADVLYSTGRYVDPGNNAMDLARPPGYPAFLAIMQAVGLDRLGDIVIVQLLMGGVVCLLLFLVCREAWSREAGLVAALIYALNPNSVLWATSIYSDTLFTLLVMSAGAALWRLYASGRAGWAILAGLTLGIATLTRPIGLAMILLWSLAVAGMALARRMTWRRAIILAALFSVCAAVVVVPWAYRNKATHGVFAVSTIDTFNLGYYQASSALARGAGITIDEARARVMRSDLPVAEARARYLGVIAQYPREYLAIHLQGTLVLLTEVGQPCIARLVGEHYRFAGILVALREEGPRAAASALGAALRDPTGAWFFLVPAVSMAVLYGTYGLGLWGIGKLTLGQRKIAWLALLCSLTVLALVLIPGPVGNDRFRLPTEPFLCVLAGIGATAKRDESPAQSAALGT